MFPLAIEGVACECMPREHSATDSDDSSHERMVKGGAGQAVGSGVREVMVGTVTFTWRTWQWFQRAHGTVPGG